MWGVAKMSIDYFQRPTRAIMSGGASDESTRTGAHLSTDQEHTTVLALLFLIVGDFHARGRDTASSRGPTAAHRHHALNAVGAVSLFHAHLSPPESQPYAAC